MSKAPRSGREFETWDLDVEASREGKDGFGFPYYVWRESADNRVGLSRPRYCCITPVNDQLYFTFFNPSEDIKPTGAGKAAIAVGVLMGVWFVISMIAARFERATGPGDHGVPPGMALIAFVGTALFLGMAVFWVWNTVETVLRWRKNRFEGDGRISMVPWEHLVAFSRVTPEENGAPRGENGPKTGHELQATFGVAASPMELTNNRWNARSITDMHRELTLLFVVNRDPVLSEWVKLQKRRRSPVEPAGTKKDPLDFNL